MRRYAAPAAVLSTAVAFGPPPSRPTRWHQSVPPPARKARAIHWPRPAAAATSDASAALRLNNNEGDGQDNGAGNILIFPATALSTTATLAATTTLWSEYAVLRTGCGPSSLPDAIERGCYLVVLAVAGISVFLRIVTGEGVASLAARSIGSSGSGSERDAVVLQCRVAEWTSLLAVLGAFVALQYRDV
ncbi:hypothetical protein ACHAXT_011846 [Thalassiosira profunda]